MEPDAVADGDGEAQLGQAGRDLGALLERARGGDEDADAAGEERLERFHAESADLEVVLLGLVGQCLALGIEAGQPLGEERLEIGLDGVGAGGVRRDHDPQPPGQRVGERGGDERRRGAGQAAEAQDGATAREPFQQLPERRLAPHRLDQGRV